MQIETIRLEQLPSVEDGEGKSLAGLRRMGAEKPRILQIFGREAPKRGPLDWRDKPPDKIPFYDAVYIREDTDYLDGLFKRLYQGSGTFRILAESPHVKDHVAMVDVSGKLAGCLNAAYGEVDIGAQFQGTPSLEAHVLLIVAHEYRHVWQLENNASIYNSPMHSLEILALQRAMEADANAFGATCLYEALSREGYGHKVIKNILPAGYLKTLVKTLCRSIEDDQNALNSGLAATKVFNKYMEKWNRKTLRTYDDKFINTFNMRANRLNYTTCPKFSEASDAGYASRVTNLAKMPFQTEEGTVFERPLYMKDGNAAEECLMRMASDNKLLLKHYGII